MSKPIMMTPALFDKVVEQAKDKFLNKRYNEIKGDMTLNLSIKVQEPVTVEFTMRAWMKVQQLVQAFTGEVGWHGTAHRDGKGKYVIDDIIVYPQNVTAVTVVADQVEYQDWLNDLDDEVFNNLRFHGHSHVNMGTSPSSTDRALYDGILSQLEADMFYVFMIFNKRGEMFVEVYDMAENMIYEKDDVKITSELFDEDAMSFINSAKKIVDTSKKSTWGSKKGGDAKTAKTVKEVKPAFSGSSTDKEAVSTKVQRGVVMEEDEEFDDDYYYEEALNDYMARKGIAPDYRRDYYADDCFDDDFYDCGWGRYRY